VLGGKEFSDNETTRSRSNINKNLVLLVCFNDHLRSLFIIGECRVITEVVQTDALDRKIVSSMNVIH
jgi:hypothetical protein